MECAEVVNINKKFFKKADSSKVKDERAMGMLLE